MTKSQCYAEISRCQECIAAYNTQITNLNAEISELTTLTGKVAALQSSVSGLKKISDTNITKGAELDNINKRIVQSVDIGMPAVVSGSLYNTSYNGLDYAIGVINAEVTKKQNKIVELQNCITEYGNKIQQYTYTIAQIEEQERIYAAWAAEQQRLAAEAEKAKYNVPTVSKK